MSKSREKYVTYVREQQGVTAEQQAETRRQETERGLQMQEQMLGTEEQVAGYDIDPRMREYSGRYSMDEQLLGVVGSGKYGPKFYGKMYREAGYGSMTEFGVGQTEKLNSMMQAAQDAAEAGDWDRAAELKQEADAFASQFRDDLGEAGQGLSFAEDPEFAAKAGLSSPIAQITGELVRQGRAFLDPESEESQRLKRTMTEGAERSIAAQSRQAQRQMRDFGLQRGAARTPGRAATMAQRVAEDEARQRADQYTKINVWFEEFSRSFAGDTVKFARDFLQNAGGIREQYQGALDNLTALAMNFANASAERHASFAEMENANEQMRKEFQREMIGAAVAIATIGLGGAAGGFVGAIGQPGVFNPEAAMAGAQTAAGSRMPGLTSMGPAPWTPDPG